MSNSTCTPATEPVSKPAVATKIQPQWTVAKSDDGTVISIALPGVGKDDLTLTTGNGFLKLEATRKASAEGRLIQGSEAPAAYHLGLKLAASLDGGNAGAKFEDGILTVTLPIAESAKPRRIEVA